MDLEIVVRLAAGLVLVAANAFFVATEFALTRLRQIPAGELGDDPRLRTAWEMTERLEIHLTGCQLGISLTSIVLGIVTEPAVTRLLAPLAELLGLRGRTASIVSVVVAVVLINLVHKIWGEQAPTYLGVERPKEVAQRFAPALDLWTRTFLPVIRLGDGAAKASLRLLDVEITRSWTRDSDDERPRSFADLRRQMGELLSRGQVPRDRRREVLQALAIARIPVREIMVPTDEVTALSIGRSLEENFERIGRTRHARYPLLDAAEEEFVGAVYVPALFERLDELLAGDVELADLAAPGVRVRGDLPVSELIDRLQAEHQEVALVEEDGRVAGLVTITDAFEQIAGEVEDPLDRREVAQRGRSTDRRTNPANRSK